VSSHITNPITLYRQKQAKRCRRRRYTKGIIWLLLVVVATSVALAQKRSADTFILAQQADIDFLISELVAEKERGQVWYDRIVEQQQTIEELEKRLEELQEILQWPATEKEITFYAPLDPSAVEGMCYSGDPTVTASGAESKPGVTIAAGPGIPYGTEIYIPGIGYRVVEDRGSAISNNHIDVMVWDRAEALDRGRYEEVVYVNYGR